MNLKKCNRYMIIQLKSLYIFYRYTYIHIYVKIKIINTLRIIYKILM